MTVGLAVIYSNGVVLGSDSQGTGTYRGTDFKDDVIKVQRLGSRVGIVAAGDLAFYQELTNSLRKESYDIEPAVIEVALEIATEASRLYAIRAARLGRQFGRDQEIYQVLQEMAQLAPISLLIGGIDMDGTPRVYAINPPFSFLEETRFGITGSGKPYAVTIMKPRYRSTARLDDAARWIVRAISVTSELDPFVGGKIQLDAIGANVAGEPFNQMGEEQIAHYLNDVLIEDTKVKVVTGYLAEDDFTSRRLKRATRNLRTASTEFDERLLEELSKRQTPL